MLFYFAGVKLQNSLRCPVGHKFLRDLRKLGLLLFLLFLLSLLILFNTGLRKLAIIELSNCVSAVLKSFLTLLALPLQNSQLTVVPDVGAKVSFDRIFGHLLIKLLAALLDHLQVFHALQKQTLQSRCGLLIGLLHFGPFVSGTILLLHISHQFNNIIS